MAGAADLEEDPTLTLELDLLVIQLPREEHQAVGGDELVARQPVESSFHGSGHGGRGHALHLGLSREWRANHLDYSIPIRVL